MAETLRLISKNELPFEDYDLDGFVRELSITFQSFSRGKWNLEHLKATRLPHGKLDRTPYTGHLYIIFIKGDSTGFDKRFGAFLRGEIEGGIGCMKMLKRATERCACCGLPDQDPLLGSFTVEHKVPVSFGGSSFINNLEVVHHGCNNLLGRHDIESKELLKDAMRLYSDELHEWIDPNAKHKIRKLKRVLMGKTGLTSDILLTARPNVS